MSSTFPEGRGTLRLAYLSSRYPALSHTFIEREIRAVRALGLRIDPFSIRPPGAQGTLGAAHRDACRETFTLLERPLRVGASLVRALIASPAGALRALVAAERLSSPGVTARVVSLAYALEAMHLARELRRRGIAHVHVHMANNAASVALLACRYDRSLTYSLSVHGSAEFFHVDSWRLGPKAAGAVFVRCISHFCRAQLMAWTDRRAWQRYHIVHCGIDLARFPPRPPRRPGPLRLITVGRLDPIKGYFVLLDAMAILGREGAEVELEMVGDGPERAALDRRIAARGLSGRVVLSGAVSQDEIGAHYDHADAMVVCSFMEGVPVVLMEAMAKELCVVATRVGGIPELVEDGVSGLLVDAGSAEALAAPIKKLAADPDRCRTYGIAGRARVAAAYSSELLGAGMAELFRGYLGGAVPASGRSAPCPD